MMKVSWLPITIPLLFLLFPGGTNSCSKVERARMNTLTIHYHRYDQKYDEWRLWTWVDTTSLEVRPAGKDEFGLIFRIDLSRYPPKNNFNFLPKFRDWQQKDAPDRSWSRSLKPEIWILQGNAAIFTQKPETDPFVRKAFLESPREITTILTKPLKSEELPDLELTVILHNGARIPAVNATLYPANSDSSYVLKMFAEREIALSELPAKVEVQGFEPGDLYLRGILDSSAYKSNEPLGAFLYPDRTEFVVFAPGATQVTLNLYKQASGGEAQKYQLSRQKDGSWKTAIPENLEGSYYTYQVSGPDPSYSPQKELVDPYARCVTVHNGRALLYTDQTPIADSPSFSFDQAIIYEMHVRDFSISESSGAHHKGKYLGFAESGTTLPGTDVRTTLDHLVELGVNTVQLLPIQDFEHDAQTNNYFWGYMTVNFNSPDGWYTDNVEDAGRVREFKNMVDALHKHGIKVVLDVVYNHTAEGNPEIQYNFNGFAPGHYYRQRIDGTYWNGSGTGNEMRNESSMVRRFIIESLEYWVEEYKIDGFRFDLLGLLDLKTVREIVRSLRAINPDIFIYGEPWAAGETPIEITGKGKQRSEGFAVFNDNFRDALKGPWYNTEPGYVQTGKNVAAVKKGIVGAIDDFTDSPQESINYAACHDGRTLWDQLIASTELDSSLTDTQLKAMDKLAALILFTSQGVPFMHGGQEFLRTKFGSHNSYNQPDRVNKIRWEFKQENADVFHYYQGLIALRKAHPVFRMKQTGEIRKNLAFFEKLGIAVPANCIGYRIARGKCKDSWKEVLVLINPNRSDQDFSVPPGEWQMVVNEARAGEETISVVSGNSVRLKAISGMILYRL